MRPTFIITRPIHQADNLHQQIKNAGGECIVFPTIEILPCNSPELNLLFPRTTSHRDCSPGTADKIIFVSANAVHAVMPYWQKEIRSSVFAIGPGTANALREYQIDPKIPANGNYNSEGLLALPEMQLLFKQSVIIFSGEGGRTLLAESLQQRGANVKKIAVYKRIQPVGNISTQMLHDWQAQSIAAIIVTSAESLRNLHTMIGRSGRQWLYQQRLLVISPAMQTLALQLGFVQQPIVADNASDGAIIRALFGNHE